MRFLPASRGDTNYGQLGGQACIAGQAGQQLDQRRPKRHKPRCNCGE
jgi:hypothetical protein